MPLFYEEVKLGCTHSLTVLIYRRERDGVIGMHVSRRDSRGNREQGKTIAREQERSDDGT